MEFSLIRTVNPVDSWVIQTTDEELQKQKWSSSKVVKGKSYRVVSFCEYNLHKLRLQCMYTVYLSIIDSTITNKHALSQTKDVQWIKVIICVM